MILLFQLEEVLPIVVSNAFDMSPESVEELAIKLGQEEAYQAILDTIEDITRGELVEKLLKGWKMADEGASLLRLKVALRGKTNQTVGVI